MNEVCCTPNWFVKEEFLSLWSESAAVAPDVLLLEDGTDLLLEDGTNILLE